MPEQRVMTMRELHARLEELGKESAENWDAFIWTVDNTRSYRALMNDPETVTVKGPFINNQKMIEVELSSSINR